MDILISGLFIISFAAIAGAAVFDSVKWQKRCADVEKTINKSHHQLCKAIKEGFDLGQDKDRLIAALDKALAGKYRDPATNKHFVSREVFYEKLFDDKV